VSEKLNIFRFWKRRKTRKIKYLMRGYRYLKVNNELDKIETVIEALSESKIHFCNDKVSNLFFGSSLDHAELCIRQYLLVRLAGLKLNKALLCALGNPSSKIIYPLPPMWREVLQKHGFMVNRIWTPVAWQGFIILMFLYGVYTSISKILGSVAELVGPQREKLGRYSYFNDLARGNLPKFNRNNKSYNIVSWYEQWAGKINNLETLCHSVKGVSTTSLGKSLKVTYIPSAIRPITNLDGLMRFIVWGLCVSVSALSDIVRGRWWSALLLREACFAKMVRLQDKDNMAREYFFHNSGWVYRPLWTYEAKKKGSRISFYFYSTNCETFKRSDGYPKPIYGWNVANWPLYLVWDKYQADFVRRVVADNANINVVGSIWFSSNALDLPVLPRNSVAVFDVQPHRSSRYQLLGLASEYYVPRTTSQFLLDIQHVLSKYHVTVVHKRKRNIGKMLHPTYAKLVEEMSHDDLVINIDPDVSAIKVIEKCRAVISMPFTSTAVLGIEQQKPSIYYDPHGVVQKDDRAAHGIPIVAGIDELDDWIKKVISIAG